FCLSQSPCDATSASPKHQPSVLCRRRRYEKTGSSADRDHLSVRLIIISEIMLLRFSIDHVEEKLAQFIVVRPSPQRLHDVELEITAETRAQFSVASETKFIAAFAEVQVRHPPDKTNTLLASRYLIVRRGTICPKCCFGNQISKLSFNRALRFGNRQEIFVV